MSHFVVGCVLLILMVFCFFFFIATPTTSIYTLSLHDALPIFVIPQRATFEILDKRYVWVVGEDHVAQDRKSTRLNSSHVSISYAVFCLKKKKKRKLKYTDLKSLHSGLF